MAGSLFCLKIQKMRKLKIGVDKYSKTRYLSGVVILF